jgi:hypothetical protein
LNFIRQITYRKQGTISNPIFFAWAFNLEKERKKVLKKSGSWKKRSNSNSEEE